ncbi:hypothetical protein DIZ81_10870 [Legionella taurinensis]|uniref:Uncharacterized protein n=1 Tax=Legionella taurinensis TaxID=70611 RepID=A0A3A5L786_9GAMM|nr:hypothetical protein [Legionella taurinensis]MDX1838351.1 hypothetical protein [Legionella taurinensis]PUT39113.1 hypothetical protein DB744_10880 [Legionella taurinensis]PUT39567.1 hypothetical protein DB746_13535 [Legionella taurinensis]PUT43569.1 hypothetical protein DB743_10270 [Legionella taurinensis]PUT45223.1 hypothetical protein DB745_13475 [Legionella taurinensis]
MKLYRSLSETMAVLQRKPNEVIAIISLNGQAYFVFRSNPSPQIATLKQAKAKIGISNELSGPTSKHEDEEKTQRLYRFMLADNVPSVFPESNHAEENLIRGFPDVLTQFKATFPEQKIINITIFLSHSPCAAEGEKKHSEARSINGFFLPPGCNKKLSAFFDKGNYKAIDEPLFVNTKFKVQYLYRFNHTVEEQAPFIQQADPLLHSVLAKMERCGQ